MTRISRRITAFVTGVVAGVLLSLGSLVAWVAVYPDGSDPKNIGYVLWKHGLNRSMNLDQAAAGMVADTDAVNIVKGLSKGDLKQRFGYVRTLDEASSYMRQCATQPLKVADLGDHSHTDVVFLRDGPWMAVLDRGRTVDLVLCKGY